MKRFIRSKETPATLQSGRLPGSKENRMSLWLNKQEFAYDEKRLLARMLDELEKRSIIEKEDR